MPKKLYERGPAMTNTPEVHGGIKFYPKYTAEAKQTWKKMLKKRSSKAPALGVTTRALMSQTQTHEQLASRLRNKT